MAASSYFMAAGRCVTPLDRFKAIPGGIDISTAVSSENECVPANIDLKAKLTSFNLPRSQFRQISEPAEAGGAFGKLAGKIQNKWSGFRPFSQFLGPGMW